MSVAHTTRPASIDEIAAEMDRRGAVIEKLEAHIERLEAHFRKVAKAAFFAGAAHGSEAINLASGATEEQVRDLVDLDAAWQRDTARHLVEMGIADAKKGGVQ